MIHGQLWWTDCVYRMGKNGLFNCWELHVCHWLQKWRNKLYHHCLSLIHKGTSLKAVWFKEWNWWFWQHWNGRCVALHHLPMWTIFYPTFVVNVSVVSCWCPKLVDLFLIFAKVYYSFDLKNFLSKICDECEWLVSIVNVLVLGLCKGILKV